MQEKGFSHILLFLIIFLGLAVGLYLVSQKTSLLSQAFYKDAISRFILQEDTLSEKESTQSATATRTSNKSFLSAYQRLLLRKSQSTPARISSVTQPSANPTIKPTPALSGSPPLNPSPTPTQPSPTPSPSSRIKPVCSITVIPSGITQAPFITNICIGNNSTPYQPIREELVDYDGNGNWDYQGSFYGCHSFIFQNHGSYYPKAKIIAATGEESNICQTTVIVTNPSPSPSLSPSPSPSVLAGPTVTCPAPGTTATFNWPTLTGASKYYLKIDNVKDLLNCTRNPDDLCFMVINPPATYSTTPGNTYRWNFDALDSNNNVIQNVVGNAFTCAN